MFKKDTNIESYEGNDAFYSGTDEEYEEFLKNADIKMNDGEEAQAVENTRRINLNETINIQSVIDKFKKTAGGIENGAKKIKDSVVSKMDALKTKAEEDGIVEEAEEIADKLKDTVKKSAEKTDKIKKEASAAIQAPEKINDMEMRLQEVSSEVSKLSEQIKDISSMLDVIEVENRQRMKEHELNCDDIKQSVGEINSGVNEIRQAVNSVSKLNDSLFDLKNTQLNTKKALSNLETGFSRLKKKCVLGVTVLSVLSAIIIVLEIILMLS